MIFESHWKSLVVVELWVSNPSPHPMLAAVIELRESKNKRHHTGGDTDGKGSSGSGRKEKVMGEFMKITKKLVYTCMKPSKNSEVTFFEK